MNEKMLSRRRFLKNVLVPAGALAVFPPPPAWWKRLFAATEKNTETKIVKSGNLLLVTDNNGVPVSYRFGDSGQLKQFSPEQIQDFVDARKRAMRQQEYSPTEQMLVDPESYRPVSDAIPANNPSEEVASITPPEDICSPESLLQKGVIIHNPDESAPQLFIRESAFQPDGPLYPILLLSKITDEIVLETFTENGPYIDDAFLDEEQRAALDAAENTYAELRPDQINRGIEYSDAVLWQYSRERTSRNITSLKNIIKKSIKEKIVQEAANGVSKKLLAELYFELDLVRSLPDSNLIFHYADEAIRSGLDVVRGITSFSSGITWQQTHLAIGFPPPEFDMYTIVFEPSGNPLILQKEIRFNAHGSKAASLFENRAVTLPSPASRKDYEQTSSTGDSYVVDFRDLGFIANHEFTHVRKNAVNRLIELGMVSIQSDGTLAVIAGSRLEKILNEANLDGVPWFINQKHPIDTERETDKAAKESMDRAYREWKEAGSDKGFYFVISIPPENGEPTRYKITQSLLGKTV